MAGNGGGPTGPKPPAGTVPVGRGGGAATGQKNPVAAGTAPAGAGRGGGAPGLRPPAAGVGRGVVAPSAPRPPVVAGAALVSAGRGGGQIGQRPPVQPRATPPPHHVARSTQKRPGPAQTHTPPPLSANGGAGVPRDPANSGANGPPGDNGVMMVTMRMVKASIEARRRRAAAVVMLGRVMVQLRDLFTALRVALLRGHRALTTGSEVVTMVIVVVVAEVAATGNVNLLHLSSLSRWTPRRRPIPVRRRSARSGYGGGRRTGYG
nr:basic proline-rich protein-like [Aegilops tauschii subsp. strangulata]